MQEKMKNYCIDIFGDKLLTEPLAEYPLKEGVKLPSPEEMKYKILCKFRNKKMKGNKSKVDASGEQSSQVVVPTAAKYSNSETQLPENDSFDNLESSDIAAANLLFSQETSSFVDAKNSEAKSEILSHLCQRLEQKDQRDMIDYNHLQDQSDSDSEKEDTITSLISTDNNSITISKKGLYSEKGMASVVNYVLPYTFRSFENSRKRNRSFEMSSFNENNAFNLHKEKPSEFVNYNKKQLSRIYPKGTRFSSDNYLPQIFWNIGCQMVALNFQTLDISMQLNNGKFEYNNRCGYLLKPDIMTNTKTNKQFDPFAESPIDGIVATTLNIRILNGIFLSRISDSMKHVGQTAMVELYGLPADSVRSHRSHRVKATSSSSFNVNYSDPNGFTFKKIIMPQLATLAFSVYDEQGKIYGRSFLPVTAIRPGYRFINLKNESNQSLNMCSIFVHIDMRDYVPDHFEEFANALVDPISYLLTQSKKEEMLRTLYDDRDQEDLENDKEENTSELDKNASGSQDKKTVTADCDVELTPLQVALRDQRNRQNSAKSMQGSRTKSVSLNFPENELESEWKIIKTINFAQPDGEIVQEKIQIPVLATSKSYQQILTTFNKKIEKIVKDEEKKQTEIEQSLYEDLEKLKDDSTKKKQRHERKFVFKEAFKKAFRNRDQSASSFQFDSLEIEQDLKNLISNTRRKYVDAKINSHVTCFQKIKKVNLLSIETLAEHLKKMVEEITKNHMIHLKNIVESDLANLNKLTMQHIKLKKKKIISSESHSKEEIHRLTREIEKECVEFAVKENAKMEEILKTKQNQLKEIVQKSHKEIDEFKKEKETGFEIDANQKLESKKDEIRKMFLLDSDQKTSAKEPPNHQTLDTLKKERRRKALEKDQDNMTRM